MELLEHYPPHESGHVISQPRSLLHISWYLLGRSALLSNLVNEGDGLPNVGHDALGEFALVAEDFGAIDASGNKGEAFLLAVGLKKGQPRFSKTGDV